MKTIALILFLGLSCPASAGYKEAEAAGKNLGDTQLNKELDALLAQPGAALARDARAAQLLADNGRALALFRQAAQEPNDGDLLAPKPEKLDSKTVQPKYGVHIKLLKLLLIDSRIKAARSLNGEAEKDLLAVAGFLSQLSAQKAGALLSSMVEQVCLMKAYPMFSDSLRAPSVSPGYMKELALRLDNSVKNQDSMRAAMLQEADTAKGSMVEAVTPESMAAERAKMSFLLRLGAKKLEDQEFFSKVYSGYDAAVDAHAGVLIEAFRVNDPAPAAAYMEKRQQEIQARKQARDKRGTLAGIIDGLKGGPEAKKEMEDTIVDRMLSIGTPAYEKLVPRYHLYLTELYVLRTAVAVKLYQRARRRLPGSLDQLVPAYLAAVPLDSFNKFAPLAYVKKGKKILIYGFGPDGKDGGGAASLDVAAYYDNAAKDAGDIVFAD